jgi:hypothetical protein
MSKTEGENMKKILIIVTFVLMSMGTAYAGGNNALKHANPMPNLMRIAMGNAELLNISGEQMKGLHAWANENKPKMMMMVKQVMSQEKILREEALATDKDIMKKADEMLETRRKIMEMKTACRATLRGILNEKQYAQVISIYRSSM